MVTLQFRLRLILKSQVAVQREKWARQEGYPKRVYYQLGDPDCTSEDEKVDDHFVVKSKPG